MSKIYFLRCKNKGKNVEAHNILLPLPIRSDEAPQIPLLWPTDRKPRNIMCRQCSHAYEYTVQEVDWNFDKARYLEDDKRADNMHCIEARCREEHCGLPVYVLMPGLRSEASVLMVDAGWFEEGKHGLVRCSAGHLTSRIQGIDIHSDSDHQFWR